MIAMGPWVDRRRPREIAGKHALFKVSLLICLWVVSCVIETDQQVCLFLTERSSRSWQAGQSMISVYIFRVRASSKAHDGIALIE